MQALCAVTLSFFTLLLLHRFSDLIIKVALSTPPSGLGWYEIFFFKKWPIRSRRSIIIRLELKFLLWCVSQLSFTNQSEQNKRKKGCPEPLGSAQEPSTTNNKVKIRERNGASNPYVVLKSQATLTTMSLYEHYGLCGMDQFIKTMGQ